MIGLRKSGIVLLLSALTACGSPDAVVSPNAPVAPADIQRIYLATDRVLADDLSGTTQRAGALPSLSDFGRTVRGAAGPLGRPIDSAVIYVHGFNTAMEYAVYRHAQTAHDYSLQGPLVDCL